MRASGKIFPSQATVPPPCTFLFHCPHPLPMKSSELRLHNRCRDLSCVILGVRPVFPFIDNSTTTLPNGASLRLPLQDRKKEGRLGAGGLAMQRRLGHVPLSSRSHGRGCSGLLDENAWEEPLYEAILSPPQEGREGLCQPALCWVSAMVQPVSGQTRCDHSEALGRMALATLLRAEPGQLPRGGCGRPWERRRKEAH